MADKPRLVDYFYTHCMDSPGDALRILSVLKDSGVNLLAFSAFPDGPNRSQIDFIPENAETLQQAARKAGVPLSERKRCFLIDGADRPGAVGEILKVLADAKINVTACDAVCAGNGRYGAILWVAPAALQAAARALGA
jgi:hypothetical protein